MFVKENPDRKKNCLDKGIFPDYLKYVQVVPVLKKRSEKIKITIGWLVFYRICKSYMKDVCKTN